MGFDPSRASKVRSIGTHDRSGLALKYPAYRRSKTAKGAA
jgi:hypothetical protein